MGVTGIENISQVYIILAPFLHPNIPVFAGNPPVNAPNEHHQKHPVEGPQRALTLATAYLRAVKFSISTPMQFFYLSTTDRGRSPFIFESLTYTCGYCRPIQFLV